MMGMRGFFISKCRLGHTFHIGPPWLRFTWCRYGWSLYAFRRRIAWKPIDYNHPKLRGGAKGMRGDDFV